MENDILSALEKLVSFESTKDHPEKLTAAIDYIQDWWADATSTRRFLHNGKSSLILDLHPDSHPQLLLNGHADVVPGIPDQFVMKIKGKKAFGRGTQDMKSGLATMLVLLKSLKNAGHKFPISLMIVTDEEIGGFDGTKKLLTQLKLKPDLFIAGEPTDLKIEYTAKGVTWAKLKTTGTRAHGAYPWEGKNAIHKLSDEIQSLYQLFPEPHKFVWATTCNIGQVSGGLATNQVPGEAEATLDIRRIPTESTAQVTDKIRRAFRHPNTQLEVLLDEPSHQVRQGHPHVLGLSASIKKITGKEAAFVQKCGASDARHASHLGIPAVCFGPSGAGLHTDSEYLDTTSLESYFEILKDFTLAYFHV